MFFIHKIIIYKKSRPCNLHLSEQFLLLLLKLQPWNRWKTHKRGAAGKAFAEKKTDLRSITTEAAVIISNNQGGKETPAHPLSEGRERGERQTPLKTISTRQHNPWLTVASIVLWLIRLYYKHEEIKSTTSAVFSCSKKTTTTNRMGLVSVWKMRRYHNQEKASALWIGK